MGRIARPRAFTLKPVARTAHKLDEGGQVSRPVRMANGAHAFASSNGRLTVRPRIKPMRMCRSLAENGLGRSAMD